MNTKDQQLILYALLAIAGGFLLLRLLLAFRFAALPILGVILLSVLVWQLLLRRRRSKAARNYERSTDGQITQKIDYCRNQLVKNKEEINRIEKSLDELAAQEPTSEEVGPKVWAESQRLMDSFRAELRLRKAKADFFATSVKKLTALEKRHELARQLAEKKAQLRELQENHFDDIADLESLKTELELSTQYLNTIDDLSSAVLDTDSPEATDQLRLDLEKMTEELGRT